MKSNSAFVHNPAPRQTGKFSGNLFLQNYSFAIDFKGHSLRPAKCFGEVDIAAVILLVLAEDLERMRNKIAGWAVKVGLSIAVLSLVTGSAFADPSFDITGSTTGQFSLLGVPLGTSLNGLSFNGSDFGPTTVTNGSDVQINLGTFTLNTLLSYFDPFDFKLSVNFTAPTVGGTVFKADLSGLVSIFGGSATVNFIDNGPRHFSYSNSTGAGSFDLYLSDMRVNNHSQASIQGRIMNVSANPEPAAIALTSALMGGLLFLFRRRLRNS